MANVVHKNGGFMCTTFAIRYTSVLGLALDPGAAGPPGFSKVDPTI